MAKCGSTNADYTAGNGDGGQAGATVESAITDAGYAARNGDGGQAGATGESEIADAGHAARNGDGGQAGATGESEIADAGHTTIGRNDAGAASSNQYFAFCVDKTVVLAMVYRIFTTHRNAG